MPFRVYVQKGFHDLFVDTGVIETNPEQQENWREICQHYGYNAFRFIPEGEPYHLSVAKRRARQRSPKEFTNANEHIARPARNRKNRNVLENC